MQGWTRRLTLGIALAFAALASTHAQQPSAAVDAAKGPPPGFVAPPLPKPDETNGERARSQPGNNAPFWREVRRSGEQKGVTSLPGAEMGTLIQRFVQYPGSRYTTAGEAWRQVRNRWIIPYGGSLMLIVVVALALYYWRKGALGGHVPATGRVIERFTPFERAAHWANAIAFVVLGVSGIVIAFGKFFLLPILGLSLFGWLTYALKTLHNIAGPLFAVSLLVVIVTFARDELPRKGDLAWFRSGGGLIGNRHEEPSHRFNAGEKAMFWGAVVVLGVVLVASGLVLDKLLPGLDYLRGDMQIAHMVHSVSAVLMMAVLLMHIYLGTIGMKGAYQGMRTGYVDEAWGQEHHELWYRDIKAGRIPAQRSGKTAPAVVTPAGSQT